MPQKMFAFGFLVASFAFPACSESTAPAAPVASGEASSVAAPTNAPQGVIPQAQLDAMAKAAATGTVLEQAEQERRKQMEAQGL